MPVMPQERALRLTSELSVHVNVEPKTVGIMIAPLFDDRWPSPLAPKEKPVRRQTVPPKVHDAGLSTGSLGVHNSIRRVEEF